MLLSEDAKLKLSSGFGGGSDAYKEILNSAEKSKFLLGLLNKFGALGDWKFKQTDKNSGTFVDSSREIIGVDSAWEPTPKVFASGLAHELGHVLLEGGLGGAIELNVQQAIDNGLASEAVAVISEYIVATQLGLTGGESGRMHSDQEGLLTAKLDEAALSMGIDDLANLHLDSALLSRLIKPGSPMMKVAMDYYATVHPSNAPLLTYKEYYAAKYVVSFCGGDVNIVDWGKVDPTMINYEISTRDGGLICKVDLLALPLKAGVNGAPIAMHVSGTLGPDGIITSTLFGAHGQMLQQTKFDETGSKVLDALYGVDGRISKLIEFYRDGSYRSHLVNADGSEVAALFGVNGQMVEYASFDVNGFKTQAIFYGSNGKKTQQYEFGLDGTSKKYVFSADGSQTAAVFDKNGKMVEYALFDVNGFKTHDIFYASNGKKTQQYEFSLDGTSKKYVFSADGSQTAAVFDKNGKMVEYALFDVNGFKTHDIFYGSNGKKTLQYEFKVDAGYTKYVFGENGSYSAVVVSAGGKVVESAAFDATGFKTQTVFYGESGKKTEQYDYRADKSFTKYLFNGDGSQVVALFGANGQMKEYASFDAAGIKTQAIYFATNGAKTQQYDFHADKSLTKYVFNTDGSQTVALFGANGQITEYAAFNAGGFKTQGIYYGADGNKAKQFDFKLDGSFTAYTFNSDGSQTAALFGANGQMTQHATFNAAGKKTVDLFYGANGKVEKKFEFNPDGTYMSHVFNHDGTQVGALFGSNGKMIEYAAFDASGFNTKYVFYSNGAKAKQYEFSIDKSYIARTFGGSFETAALFGVNNIINIYCKYSSGTLYERNLFDSIGRQTEMDRFNMTTGALTGITKYAYNNDGTYWASDYNASGYMTAKSKFSGDGQWLSNELIYTYAGGGSGWPTGKLYWGFQV